MNREFRSVSTAKSFSRAVDSPPLFLIFHESLDYQEANPSVAYLIISFPVPQPAFFPLISMFRQF